MKLKRLFVAIKIHPDPHFLKIFRGIKEGLRQERIKWVEEENIHITLKFLGETPADMTDAIIRALDHASAGIKPFDLVLENTGIFGSSYKPRVVWLGIREQEEMGKLAKNIFDELEKLGFERDRQNFVPHLTIGRIKFIQDKNRFQEIIQGYRSTFIQETRIERFYLFESILRREGPEYIVLEEFPFSERETNN